jgi:hypothetical protein
MIGWLIRATFGTILMGVAGYAFVAVPVGRRTMFEHVLAISQTQPAQEMADDVKATAGEAVDRVRASLDKPAP